MKANDFFRTYASSRLSEWEAAVVELARQGELAPLLWFDVPVSGGGHAGVVRVSHDVVAVGDASDAVRMPLTAPAAQAVLNVTGALLPTKKLAIDINQAVTARVQPRTSWPNPGPNLESYLKHSRIIDQQLVALGNPRGIVGGHKKDLIVSNRTAAGKEMIYGWYATSPVPGVPLYTDARGAHYIQPLSDIHEHGYVDYSHGIRAVSPTMIVDGNEMRTEDVYKDAALSALVSDEGPIKSPRYDARAFGNAGPVAVFTTGRPFLRAYLDGLRDTYALSAMCKKTVVSGSWSEVGVEHAPIGTALLYGTLLGIPVLAYFIGGSTWLLIAGGVSLGFIVMAKSGLLPGPFTG